MVMAEKEEELPAVVAMPGKTGLAALWQLIKAHKWILVAVFAGLVLAVTVISVPLAVIEPPTPAPTMAPTMTPCEARCQNITNKPGLVNDFELKGVIVDYLKEPLSSPHGSDIFCWDVSRVTNMSFAFSYNSDLDDAILQSFNSPLDCWNTSAATAMSGMFYGLAAFNQPIGSWDVSSVTDMSDMFASTAAFNQAIGSWDVSKVTNMRYMFWDAATFNQNLCAWESILDVSAVNTEEMFANSSCDDTTSPGIGGNVNWCQVCDVAF